MVCRVIRCVRTRWAVLLALTCCSCATLYKLEDDGCAGDCKYPFAKVCHKPTMHALACDVDHLEKHIDKYGSVVAKVPDIWGQARLTKYREEFEKEMAKDLENFEPTIQASLTRSDQAYFANSFALSAAISGRQAGLFAPRPRVVVQTSTAQGQTTEQPTAIPVPEAKPDTAVFAGFDKITRTDTRGALNLGFAGIAKNGISLEPAVLLEQKERYLNYLAQIRRNNEGDDIGDSPGYSLNLMRIPVSVLPGSCTHKGFGAEITFTITPHLSDEMLPVTFRQLVMNDLVDLLGMPVTKAIDMMDDELARDLSDPAVVAKLKLEKKVSLKTYRATTVATMPKAQTYGAVKAQSANPKEPQIEAASAYAEEALERMLKNIPASRQRVARFPFPVTQFREIVGSYEILSLVSTVYGQTREHLKANGRAYNLDVESALQEEVSAAYDMLMPDKCGDLWRYCGPEYELTKAIRSRNTEQITRLRECFMKDAGFPQLNQRPATVVLAWAIVVESALLTDKLTQDIRAAMASKGFACGHPEGQPFYLPNPPAEARAVFNEYVRCRWPIHVFALDPITQEQNIADVFSLRREMQLAMSLKFVSGNMNANNMTRFARRIEADYETIALNRTQVGFSHGENVFGWRFYPRFQTPDIESNATVLVRDLLIGGPSKNAVTRQQRLEPGMRECVAIVMMPSFVPYLCCETHGNWFRLNSPKCKEFTTADSVRLGRAVKAIETCSPEIVNAECYRNGDLARLQARAKQLEARLPLQNVQVQVPNENTLGGFEMFSNGITDLAPQLRGWYGSPGIKSDGTTSLFLVGDHFSVHQTRVVVGGVALPTDQVELLSRQIMRVSIPKGTLPNLGKRLAVKKGEDPEYPYADVHVATPYGVTAHLEVPVIQAAEAEDPAGLKWTDGNFEVAFVYQGLGIAKPNPPISRPPLVIQWGLEQLPALQIGGATTADIRVTFAQPYNDVTVEVKGLALGEAFDPNTLTLNVPGDKLAEAILTGFGTKFGPEATRPPVSVVTGMAAVVLRDKDGKPVNKPVPIVNKLTVNWVKAPK